MKGQWKDVLLAILMVILVPYILLNVTAMRYRNDLPADPGTDPATLPQTLETIWITVKNGTYTEIMDLEEYLVGVVLGEMPASFDPEALKAQAVVARTYTLRHREIGSKHDDADVCTDSACCQAYREPSANEASVDKIRSAVEATRGQVLTYGEELIEATYFSSSGGKTEDAKAVWGSDLPYLQSTDSPEDSYESITVRSVTLSSQEFQKALGRDLKGECSTWFGPVSYTKGGGVEKIAIGGSTYTGTEIRKLLDLRSTAFQISVTGDTVTITTRGYGHRVGMSQYGAEAMAVTGSTYDEILAHYYRGTVLEEYIDIGLDFG